MTIREMRTHLGDTQSEFSSRYHIPFRTIQNWEAGVRTPPEYILNLLESRVKADLINRTLADAMANESILDMQRITEALSRYYYSHGDSIEGLFPAPEYQESFARLANAAVNYYTN